MDRFAARRPVAFFSLIVSCLIVSLLAVVNIPPASAAAVRTQRTKRQWSSPALGGWLSVKNRVISSRLAQEHTWLWRHGIELREWAPDPATGKLRVWLARESPAALRFLHNEFGTAIIIASQVAPPGHLLGRANDTPNFSTGDLVDIPTFGAGCTSGPMIIANGTTSPRYMLTAGHCVNGELGISVYSNGYNMGSSIHVRYCNNCLDTAVINGNDYSQNMWGGPAWDANPPSNPPVYVEDGTAFPSAGPPAEYVTNDSAFSGEVRDIEVTYNNLTFCLTSTLCIIDLTEAWKSNTTASCEPGDSGGPWIVHEGSTQYVHVAGTTDIGQYPVSGTDGYSVCYYEQIGNILARWNSYVPSG